METMSKRWLALLAALFVVGALTAPAIAQSSGGDAPSTTVAPAIEQPDDDGGGGVDGPGEGEGEFDDWEPSAEEIAEINAEADALAAAFDAAAIDYTVVDEQGIRWVEWDYEDEAANQVADQVFTDLYGDDFDEFDDWEPSADEIAEIQAEADEVMAQLDAEGISYERVTDEFGITWPEVAEEDMEALEAILCPEHFDDDLPSDDEEDLDSEA